MAAGQGFKTFTTGEVLTAGDVNGYLMQGINVFTNAAARDAAITAPAEGQFAFTKDNNSLWYYDGAAWVASGATGDIEGVTAGVGISGGGTSGTVTITNSMATAITTNGDLIYGTGSGTFTRRGIGSTGQILTVSGGVPTWATPAGGGKILQVVMGTYAQQTTSSSSSWSDTGLTATITPSATSSKVLVLVQQNGCRKLNSNTGLNLKLLRGSTDLTTFAFRGGWTGNTNESSFGTAGTVYLDTPATTSATTYKTQMASDQGSNRVDTQLDATIISPNLASTIILMEVGA